MIYNADTHSATGCDFAECQALQLSEYRETDVTVYQELL